MKKDMIFAPAMLLIAILLFLYSATGLAAHIAISVVGVLVLAVYTSATRKEKRIRHCRREWFSCFCRFDLPWRYYFRLYQHPRILCVFYGAFDYGRLPRCRCY